MRFTRSIKKQKTAGVEYKPEVSVSTSSGQSGTGGHSKVKDNGNGIPDSIKRKDHAAIFYHQANRRRHGFRFVIKLVIW